MVKNISNPLNARKVAQILADDAATKGYSIDSRDISVFLSDHRISDLETALNQLKQEHLLPDDYVVTDSGQKILIEHDFIDDNYQATHGSATTDLEGSDILGDINTSSIEFKTQLESLKNKLITSWSGGISIDGHELDNFDRKFGRPMNYFKQHMSQKEMDISDLQAFAVVYATDHLSLGDNSKDDVYHLMFGRFDEIKEALADEYGFHYSWPQISGTSFIEMGKKFTLAPELAEFAKRFRGISGLDTYPDEVVQVFFYELITGPLLDEMIDKHLLFRWSDDHTTITDPLRWLLPPPEFNMDRKLKTRLTQNVITHTLLSRIDPDGMSLLDLLHATDDTDDHNLAVILAKKVEAALTRKSVALQFGTTLANFFENFKTNPAKVTPFLDTTLRYFSKTDTVRTVFATLEHSIRTALKNSTGIIRQYLRDISDEDLVSTIRQNMELSVIQAIEQSLAEYQDNIIQDDSINYNVLTSTLRDLNDGTLKTFFTIIFDQSFNHTNLYAKSLEPQKQEPSSSEGGMAELTHDFLSTASYHGSQNWQIKTIVNNMVENGLNAELSELICHICSYITYQVASKEGTNGEVMLMSLVKRYESKTHQLAKVSLSDGTTLKDDPALVKFLTDDLRQAHAIVALGSKIKTDTYNAWTPLNSGLAKHTRFINELLMPNMLYWQRQPRDFIMDLVHAGKVDKSQIKELVSLTNRLSLVEAYSLLGMGARADLNSFDAALNYLTDLFASDESDFTLSSKTGEAEIAMETIYLWNNLQEGSA